ncbi:unnamed protein product [marine sediment metagenome]|uniref:Uncharacterized protein n=1 Tax=marine sediment metagenome TaxID=412755 RepID=X0T397_9ZZZZ
MGKTSEEILKELREKILARRRYIEGNKDGKDYEKILKKNKKQSALRYSQKKFEQKIKDLVEKPQSKIDTFLEDDK